MGRFFGALPKDADFSPSRKQGSESIGQSLRSKRPREDLGPRAPIRKGSIGFLSGLYNSVYKAPTLSRKRKGAPFVILTFG